MVRPPVESPTAMRTVLVAGGAGRLGFKIARALTYRPDVKVRVLVQPGLGANLEPLQRLSGRGVGIFEGDLHDARSLDAAVEGAQVVVSAVNGGARTMTDGQKNLLDVSVAHRVSRFIPSDYTLDYTRLEPADHDRLAWKAEFAEVLRRASIEHTFLFNGIFMEDLISPEMGIFDFEAQTVRYWGDGEAPLDVTHSDDAAEYVAEAVLDPAAADASLNLAGDVVTLNETVARFDEMTEYRFGRLRRGGTEELRAVLSEPGAQLGSDAERAALQSQWVLFSGAARLGEPDNGRYANVYPTIMLDYISVEL